MHLFTKKMLFGYVTLCLLWMLLPALSIAMADEGGEAVQVKISSSPPFPLFREVTVLPLRLIDNRPALELTRIFVEVLDATLKYRLRQPKAGEKIPKFLLSTDPERAMEAGTRQFAVAARHQAVIGGVLVPKMADKVGKGSPAGGPFRLILHLFDLHGKRTVWTLAYNLDLEGPQELVRTRTQRAVDVLLEELVRHGDIFTHRLPAPVILSRKMVNGQARIVLLGEHQSGIAAYRLMRAGAVDTPFIPISRDVDNTRHSVVLEEYWTPAKTNGWYTVVGLNDRGLAGVPESPFYLAEFPEKAP